MHFKDTFKQQLVQLQARDFEKAALQAFRYQAQENPVYRSYLEYLSVDPTKVSAVERIPFLPIEFFKTQTIKSGTFAPVSTFTSSGTTGSVTSRHLVADMEFYRQISTHIFEAFYGNLSEFTLLALLPSYLERTGSSLIYMIEHFLSKTQKDSGFYLHNKKELIDKIKNLQKAGKKVLLFGVTFALLELAEEFPIDLEGVVVMETGGMKGRRKEMTRTEVHQFLKSRWAVKQIHSEYGMTELLSQFYSKGEEIFEGPAWTKILLRDVNDPFDIGLKHKNGGINIIDLANIDSCCFLETKDLGELVGSQGQFKVIGRFDNSDLRGCNLLVQ
ncbi:acyl transferase [Rapidithrix thailandica]|uniref:Acyl transferase n=1 Tax=Rapidithrix thailandica TaxID=413964 RepID=A0AAW9S7Z5_9BACT